MKDTVDKKYYTKQITERFLKAMYEILQDRSNGKVTTKMFGERVGIDGSNITRMEKNPDINFVTLEAIAKLVHVYDFSPHWLIKGEGEMKTIGKLEDQVKQLKNRLTGLEDQMTQMEKTIEILNSKKKGK